MTESTTPTIDETFELLSQRRGRLVLQFFDQHSNPVKLEDIAPMIAHWEADDGHNPTDGAVADVRESLHADLLPWLDDTGLVSYDPAGRVIHYDDEVISTTVANAETVLDFLWDSEGVPVLDLSREQFLVDDDQDENSS